MRRSDTAIRALANATAWKTFTGATGAVMVSRCNPR